MIVLRFGVEDLADTRFAISPLSETALSLRMWHWPGYYVQQLPWLRRAQHDLRGLDFTLLRSLVGVHRAVPGFLTPRPDSPVPDFDSELAGARAVPRTCKIEVQYWARITCKPE